MPFMVVRHVKLTDSGLKVTCTRCGAEFTWSEFAAKAAVVTLSDFKQKAQAFAQKHRECKIVKA